MKTKQTLLSFRYQNFGRGISSLSFHASVRLRLSKCKVRARSAIFLMLTLLAIVASSCKKDDDGGCQGVDCLPPATQIGEGTFGCLVNGEPFVDNSGEFNCFYQLVDGEYFFSISAQFQNDIRGIGLGSQHIEIIEGNSYQLIEIGQNNFSADLFINPESNFETNSNNPGNITVTKLNLLSLIQIRVKFMK